MPKPPMIIIDRNLRVFAGIPVARTIEVRNRVKKVNDSTKPVTTPSGLFLPP